MNDLLWISDTPDAVKALGTIGGLLWPLVVILKYGWQSLCCAVNWMRPKRSAVCLALVKALEYPDAIYNLVPGLKDVKGQVICTEHGELFCEGVMFMTTPSGSITAIMSGNWDALCDLNDAEKRIVQQATDRTIKRVKLRDAETRRGQTMAYLARK